MTLSFDDDGGMCGSFGLRGDNEREARMAVTHYYVCTTSGCNRNQPRRYTREETVKSRGHSTCLECGRPMVRRTRPLKGPNTKKIIGKTIVWPTSKPGRSKYSDRKKTIRKRIYKR